MRTEDLISLYFKEQRETEPPLAEIATLVSAVEETHRKGRRVFVFGNGGGASIAEHFTCDIGSLLEVHCLSESSSLITRLGNDIGFEHIFTEQLICYTLDRKDLVIAFSTSGNSPDIVNALEYAKFKGATTALIGGRGKAMADIYVSIEGNTFHIEDFQTSVCHIVTSILKERING